MVLKSTQQLKKTYIKEHSLNTKTNLEYWKKYNTLDMILDDNYDG